MVNEAEIREFLRSSYAPLVSSVALVSGSYQAAEDAVQEAIVRAWVNSSRGEHIDSLRAWVTTVALNLSRSGLRRIVAERKARGRLIQEDTRLSPTDHVDVVRAVTKLPRRQREVVVLRYLMDMTTREVAEALGVSEGTVKSQLARARRALAPELEIREESVTNHG